MNKIELPHNQLILNTGEQHSGIIFCPFERKSPSEIHAEQTFTSSASGPRRSPIGGVGSGWVETPDTGGTSLSKAPVGEPYVLFLFAFIYGLLLYLHRKKRVSIFLILSLLTGHAQAEITALSGSVANAGQRLTVTPTIASVPDGSVSVCWSLFYDAACENEVSGVRFHSASKTARNAVWFEVPVTPGTYYIKSALHTGSLCGGLLESYYASPLIVYPSDADLVLRRDAQEGASRVDLSEDASKTTYGAMRFSKSMLNDGSLSVYRRYNYFVSFPFDVRVGAIYGIGTVGYDWRILYYDGKGRAEEGFFAERTTNWIMIDDTDSVLHAGQGYLLQLNSISMAADNATIWPNGRDVATLYFPALAAVTDIEVVNETIPALGEAYRCTIDLSATHGSEGDRRIKDSFWRCIGSPGLSGASSVTDLAYLYAWDMTDNSLSVVAGEGFDFLPTHAYLVQHGDAIVWTGVTRPVSAIVARQRQNAPYEEIMLEIKQDSVLHDRAFVRLTEDASEAFEFGQDLIKEHNAGRANIYTMVGYERVAANVLPDSVTSVPVGVQIEQAGTYRLMLTGGAVLFDNETGNRTNDLTVDLEEGTYEGRFTIEISEAIPTRVQNEEFTHHPSAIRKVLVDGILYFEKGGKRYIIR